MATLKKNRRRVNSASRHGQSASALDHLPCPGINGQANGIRPWRWTVGQYHSMIDGGILTENDPVEMIDGELISKMPKDPSHELARALLLEALQEILPAGYFADDQRPLTTKDSEPEPDVSVIRGALRDFGKRHPGPGDAVLVVEVSNTSLDFDRNRKQQAYARAGIPQYWIVNLIDRQVEVYTEPIGGRKPAYRKCAIYQSGDSFAVALDGKKLGTLKVADLLPGQ